MFLKPCFLYFVTFVFLTACSNEFDGKDGIKTVYFPNSKIVKQVVEYKDGKRIGELKEYYRNGTLSIKQRYKNDTLTDTSFFYHENGNLKYIQILKDFKKEGTWKKFNEQGKVYEEINFKDDELNGPSTTYTYRTGRVLKKLNYKEGEMEGKQEYFYNNGKPKMTTVYHNGTQTIGTEEWTESGEKLNTDFKINVIERNGVCEFEVGIGFDQRQEHFRCLRIGDDLLHLRDREISARATHLGWLEIEDPITDAFLRPSEILFRKLILHRRTVVVDGIRSVHEDAMSHGASLNQQRHNRQD